ncbi:MAG: hypothetical protein AB1481_00645 [Candidatus Omnitrophota bacterium]
MANKEPPKLKKEASGPQPPAHPKIPGISAKAFNVIKFILGVLLLPFVYSVSSSFLKELSLINPDFQRVFWKGVITFTIIYLFVYEPAVIYQKGHRLVEIIFSFFAPFVKVAPYLLPVYTIIIFIFYLLLSQIVNSPAFFNLFLFTFGFTLILHLVFSAKTVRSKQGDFLRANYIFGLSFVYIVNVFLASLCMNVVFKEFSLVNFLNNSLLAAKEIFTLLFRQLFLS